MSKNLFKKTYYADATFVAPAGVKQIKMTAVRRNISVASVGSGSAIINSAQDAYATGFSNQGQVGDNTGIDRSSPVLVVGAKKWISIHGGGNSYHAIDQNGDGYSWGSGSNGVGGDNSISNRSSPVLIAGSKKWRVLCHGVSATSSNNDFAGGLDSNGDAYCWGPNNGGQLGDNSTTNRSSPSLVVGGRKWKRLALGGGGAGGGGNTTGFGAAIDVNGDMYAWGYNGDGVLGQNNLTNTSSPVLVQGGRKWKEVTCGVGAIFGIDLKGDMYAWGSNVSGELGDNTITNRSSPTLVAGGKKWAKFSGAFGASAIDVNNDGYSWGAGLNGGTGLNAVSDRSSPTAIVGGLKFIQIAATYTEGTGITTDGKWYAWGGNTVGQLGDNTNTNRSSPVLVLGGQTPFMPGEVIVLNSVIRSVTPGSSYAISMSGNTISVDGVVVANSNFGLTELVIEYQG